MVLKCSDCGCKKVLFTPCAQRNITHHGAVCFQCHKPITIASMVTSMISIPVTVASDPRATHCQWHNDAERYQDG